MRQTIMKMLLILMMLCFVNHTHAGKRVFWLDSYDPSNQWTAELGEAIETTLSGRNLELKIHHMDTKRNKSVEYIQRAAKNAVEMIKKYKPDVVIASEDDASKYVVKPYFKNSSIPFVFCGVNHSGDRYGYPYRNATGVVELDPIPKLIFSLSRFHFVDKVGYLAEDGTSARINGGVYKTQTRFSCVEYYAKSLREWQKYYRRAQKEVDILIIGNVSAIKDWDGDAAMKTIVNESRIPTGCVLEFMTPYAFIGCIKLASEQGYRAAETALRILDGVPVDSIPIGEPMDGRLIINLEVAKALRIRVPKSYTDKADKIIRQGALSDKQRF